MCAQYIKETQNYLKKERETNFANASKEKEYDSEQTNKKAEYVTSRGVNQKDEVIFLDAGDTCREDPDDKWNKKLGRIRQVVSLGFVIALCVLVLLFLAFLTFGILYSGIKYHGEGWHNPPGNVTNCSVAYGGILGVADGVFAYSNCNDSHISDEWNFIEVRGERSGLKWQCVEYARRYMLLRGVPEPATFADVEGAEDIWQLTSVRLLRGPAAPLVRHRNGAPASAGGSKPRAGDLLIYPRQPGGFPFGHVAVIVNVTRNSVLVAEQNWANEAWPGPHHSHSREIRMVYDAAAQTYTITDVDNITINGWMRYGV